MKYVAAYLAALLALAILDGLWLGVIARACTLPRNREIGDRSSDEQQRVGQGTFAE